MVTGEFVEINQKDMVMDAYVNVIIIIIIS